MVNMFLWPLSQGCSADVSPFPEDSTEKEFGGKINLREPERQQRKSQRKNPENYLSKEPADAAFMVRGKWKTLYCYNLETNPQIFVKFSAT